MSDPWLKFYPTDWRSDPALKMCSLAARGLWIEMIALMHEAVLAQLSNLGFRAAVVRSVQDVDECLDHWSIGDAT